MNASTDIDHIPQRRIQFGVLAAIIASTLTLWLVTRSVEVALSFAAGLAVLMFGFFALARMRPAPDTEAFSPPDWSLTIAALYVAASLVLSVGGLIAGLTAARMSS